MGNSDLLKPEAADTPSATASRPRWLIITLVVFGLVVSGLAYAQYEASHSMSAKFEAARASLQSLDLRTATLEADNLELKADLQAATQKVGLTQKQLDQARAHARKLQEAQQHAASELADHEALLGSISNDVGVVRDDVADTRESLESTRTELARAVGDLGVQSGLIARNQGELDDLKRRGERDYFDMNVAKSKQYTRVGKVSVRLNKVDTKRNKYTLTLLVNDKQIEKKDKTLLEPVQFYLPGTRQMLEIVVFEVKPNQVSGYLSVPRAEVAENRPR